MERFFNKLNTVFVFTILMMLAIFAGYPVMAEVSTPEVQGQDVALTSQDQIAAALATTDVDYTAHVSEIGWQDQVRDGQTAGTTGQGLAIEAIKINLENSKINPGDINYDVHCENVGWVNSQDGGIAGTTGQGLHAEALKVNLTGQIAQSYDIYYRVHSSYYGWLDWAKNGEIAGTTGINTKAEALEIELVRKDMPAPGATAKPNVTAEGLAQQAAINYNTVLGGNWQTQVGDGADSGIAGAGFPVTGLSVTLPNPTENSSVEYKVHFSAAGWVDHTYSNGEGAVYEDRNIEAIAVALKGIDGYSYDLYYQVYAQDYGWLGWSKNGEIAGTIGGGKRIEAVRMMMVPRGAQAPGSRDNSFLYLEGWRWPLDGYGKNWITSDFGPRWGTMHYGTDIAAPAGVPIHAVRSGNVYLAQNYKGYGNCVIIENDYTGERVYYGHMSRIAATVGTHVNQGDIIGYVGSTGNSTGNHLHIGVLIVTADFVNPMNYF